MLPHNLTNEQLRSALNELEQASYNHEQWAEGLHATLICRLAPDQRDLRADTHRACRFGQWYYKCGSLAFGNHEGFIEIGIEHERMHRHATSLLRSSVEGVPIPIKDYERFVTAMKRMRLEIATVQHEVEEALFNLDPLTGTPSRIGMLTKLREQQQMVKRKIHRCTIAMMDLDNFKTVNDKYGHVIGDKVLIDFARYVMTHLRPYDRTFRYGGEEFLLCLPGADLQTARDIVDRLREELGSFPCEAGDKQSFHVTASFGLAALDPDISVEQSIDHADKALYVAKRSGRNRAVVWDESMGLTSAESDRSA